jgi:hypothetical protein
MDSERFITGIKSRFMDKFIPEPNSGCWLWTGSIAKNGYGKIQGDRRSGSLLAHRYSFKKFVFDPGKMHVLHKCDNRCCVNPDHLFLGNRKDNMSDCAKKLRMANRKLSCEAVEDIKTKRMSQRSFGAVYGVSQTLVSRIQRGINWSWTND